MIFIGNDIVEVSRIDRLFKKYKEHFLDKVFSKKEIEIVSGKFHTSIHLSGKFAAKEASKKALMSAGYSNIYLKNIEILNKKDGAPYIIFKNFDNENNISNLQVSISHTNEYATAVTFLDITV
jgi:holo-[acyl-carrier protein] synthase